MAKYSAELQDTAGAATTMGAVAAPAASMRRIRLYDLVIGSEAAPANNAFLWTVTRTTTAGTATGVTLEPLDPADPAAVSLARENFTAEPTYAGGSLLSIPLNQQDTFRWVAAPGSELVIAATADAGLGIRTPTSSAVVITGTVFVQEE